MGRELSSHRSAPRVSDGVDVYGPMADLCLSFEYCSFVGSYLVPGIAAVRQGASRVLATQDAFVRYNKDTDSFQHHRYSKSYPTGSILMHPV